MIIKSKAPLRLGIGGGGTDLDVYCSKYVGHVFNATIDLFTYCIIEETDNKKIYFESLDFNSQIELEYQEIFKLNGNFDIYKAVYNRINSNFKVPKKFFKLTTYSDVPPKSGLGGSSTLIVALVSAFLKFYSISLDKYSLARLCFEIEREDLKIVGGAQDQYAAVFGGFNFMKFYKEKKVKVEKVKISQNTIEQLNKSMLLYFTNIQRSASVIENEKKSLLKKKQSLDSMHSIKDKATLIMKSLMENDIPRFGRLIGESWQNKKRVSDLVSNEKIDQIFEIAQNQNYYGGKISGAGGGGFIFFVLPQENVNILRENLSSFGGRFYDFNFYNNGVKTWINNEKEN